MNKKDARARRSRKTRLRIAEQRAHRLVVGRSSKELKNGGNRGAATEVGKRIAAKAKTAGIETVAFDRSGFKYHGRVKALADAAREGGLKF